MNYKQAFDNLRTESNCRHAICGDKNCHECRYHLGEGVLIESIDTILRGHIRCGQCEFFKKVGVEHICQNVNSKARKVDADYGCIFGGKENRWNISNRIVSDANSFTERRASDFQQHTVRLKHM